MNEPSSKPQSVFTPEQLALLNANTIEGIQNGFAERYAAELQRNAQFFENLATFHRSENDDRLAANLELEAEASKLAAGAELPIVFTTVRKFVNEDFGPNDSLGIAKVLPHSGKLLPASLLIESIYDTTTMRIVEHRSDIFEESDAVFSLISLMKQLELGIGFHHQQGFIPVPPTVQP